MRRARRSTDDAARVAGLRRIFYFQNFYFILQNCSRAADLRGLLFGTCFRATSTENMRSAQHVHRCHRIFVLFSLPRDALFLIARGSVADEEPELNLFYISFFVRPPS
jgi:hypothetical protein